MITCLLKLLRPLSLSFLAIFCLNSVVFGQAIATSTPSATPTLASASSSAMPVTGTAAPTQIAIAGGILLIILSTYGIAKRTN